MELRSPLLSAVLTSFAGAALGLALPQLTASAASTIYYCPDKKEDQQYSAQRGPGCIPLVDSSKQPPDERSPQQPSQLDNLQQDVSVFLIRYQKFLDCCRTDLSELRELEEMAEQLDGLLASAQANLSNYSLASRGIMLRELISRVAKARTDLTILHARLEKINDLSNRLDQLDFEEAGRQTRTIRDLQESIDRDIRAPTLPGAAKTGTAIGAGSAAGPAIGRSPKTGAKIGQEGVTGQDIGATPKNSRDIGSSGLSGFEIGATGRAGPAIGESTLNEDASSSVNSTLQRSTVGSSISDSTVGSSMNSSTIGSSMQDTSVGSSFSGSSVGSSSQNR